MQEKLENLLNEILEPLISKAVSAEFDKQRQEKTLPPYLTPDQASELSGYAKNSLYQMHSRGQIPSAIKVGGKLMFKSAEFVSWIENR